MRVFRRRRSRAASVSIQLLALAVFAGLIFSTVAAANRVAGPGAPSDEGAAGEGVMQRVDLPKNTGAPKAVAAEEPAGNGSTPGAAKERAAQRENNPAPPPAVPVPKTDDLWFSIPALGLWDQYVTNTSDFSAMDYGAIKLPNSGFPWQEGANTYIAAHRLGWPGTASYRQFYNLPLLQKGDIVYLGDVNGTTYTYRVSGFKEITPDQAREVTGPQNGRDMVSLQTCIENFGDYWTMGPNWYVRYIVQADRVSVAPAT